jgi:hypothetical protein
MKFTTEMSCGQGVEVPVLNVEVLVLNVEVPVLNVEVLVLNVEVPVLDRPRYRSS